MTRAAIKPPLSALRWMVLNEIEASTERLLHIDPTAAASELADVETVVEWLASQGAVTSDLRDAMPNDETVAAIREAARPRFRAEFIGQAWIRDVAMEVDDSRWEYTVTAAEVDAAGGLAEDSDEAADDLAPKRGDWDALRTAAGAPPEVKAWSGPYDIELHKLEP
jgi:arylsulfatase A-like enzyme